jgi:23S rRNA (pseudouridine1915-N3)-methyltransferase
MKLTLLQTGKTDESYIRDAVAIYEKRIAKYARFEIITLPDIRNARNMPASVLKEKEGDKMLEVFRPDDMVILLDDKGREFTTLQFASFFTEMLMSSKKRILFVIGGAWGFNDKIYARADHKISLSRLTFSHQMVRLLFTEQLYRAMTVIAGDPYHHE